MELYFHWQDRFALFPWTFSCKHSWARMCEVQQHWTTRPGFQDVLTVTRRADRYTTCWPLHDMQTTTESGEPDWSQPVTICSKAEPWFLHCISFQRREGLRSNATLVGCAIWSLVPRMARKLSTSFGCCLVVLDSSNGKDSFEQSEQ